MSIEVTGIDHIYVAVTDLDRSIAFYDPLMKLLGFRKGTKPVGGEPHAHYFNPVMGYSLRPTKGPRMRHDPYSPGLHHVCFRVQTREHVDTAAGELRSLGIDVTEPRVYTEYEPDYYAIFFSDPDGIRLEVVAMRRLRELIRDHWATLTEFENPLTKAGLIR